MGRNSELAFNCSSYEEYCMAYDAEFPTEAKKEVVQPAKKVKITYTDGYVVECNASSITIEQVLATYALGNQIEII